jgi:hypothetical protein
MYSAFSIGPMQIVSWRHFGNGCGSSGWNYTQTRRAGSSSGDLPSKTGNEEEKANRRRLIS